MKQSDNPQAPLTQFRCFAVRFSVYLIAALLFLFLLLYLGPIRNTPFLLRLADLLPFLDILDKK